MTLSAGIWRCGIPKEGYPQYRPKRTDLHKVLAEFNPLNANSSCHAYCRLMEQTTPGFCLIRLKN